MTTVDYSATRTISKFHQDDNFVRCVMGPIGSGKSVAMIMEMMMRAAKQKKAPDGIRYSRFLIVRNTYGELRDTTVKTFFDWIPQESGKWRQAASEFIFTQGDIHAEFLFRALDRPKDVRKLLSLEITAAFLNEAREIPRIIFDGVQGRVGRYPSQKIGGPSWWGIFIDSNCPDTDHWIYTLFEENLPEDWTMYHQPDGIGPDAENIENLPAKYYERMMAGKKEQWINVYVHGLYGDISDGRPVYPEYNDTTHTVQEDEMPPIDLNEPVYVGQDYGLTPAALFAQKINGHWNIHSEVVTEDMGAERFAGLVKTELVTRFPNCEVLAWGDPANPRSQSDESTPIQVMNAGGVPTKPSPDKSNDPILRREAVSTNLTRLAMDGTPVVRVSTRCKYFRKGMAGRYAYKRVQVIGEDRFQDKPDKNIFSHICEAGQYLFVGAGEGKRVLGKSNEKKKWAKLNYAPLGIPKKQ